MDKPEYGTEEWKKIRLADYDRRIAELDRAIASADAYIYGANIFVWGSLATLVMLGIIIPAGLYFFFYG